MGATPAAFSVSLHKYVQLDVDDWRRQMDELREFFFSVRLAQWAPFAGVVAVVRVRRGAIAGLLAGWLGAFILIKGFNENADIQANTFWRLLMPAWPAYLLLFASIPLRVPMRSTGSGRASPRRRIDRCARAGSRCFVLAILAPAGATPPRRASPRRRPRIVPITASGNILLRSTRAST